MPALLSPSAWLLLPRYHSPNIKQDEGSTRPPKSVRTSAEHSFTDARSGGVLLLFGLIVDHFIHVGIEGMNIIFS